MNTSSSLIPLFLSQRILPPGLRRNLRHRDYCRRNLRRCYPCRQLQARRRGCLLHLWWWRCCRSPAQGVGYLEADVDALDVFHGAVFGQFGGTAFKGGVEDAEAVQTDTVAVRQRLAHLSYDGFATCSTSSADMAPSASMSCAIRARSKILASWGLRFRV